MLLLLLYLAGVGISSAQIQQHYRRGVELLQQAAPAQAIVEFEAALKQDPKLAEARHGIALARLAQGNPVAAREELQRAIGLKPGLVEAHLAMGLAVGQSGDLEGAAAAFRDALRLRPNYAEAHKRLGITLRRMSQPKAALAEFQLAVTCDERDPGSWYELGQARKAEGDLNGAIESFQHALTIKPDFESARYNLGILLRRHGDAEAGQKMLQEVKDLHEFRTNLTESKLRIQQGVEALKQDRANEAVQLFQRATELSPALPTAWHFLGVAWERTGEKNKAMAAWSKALELQPDYPKSHASIGLMRARAGDFEGAVKELRESISADSDDAQTHYNLGLVLAKLGRLAEARTELAECLSLEPRSTDARMQMALMLTAQNEVAAAAAMYRELIRQYPAFAEAHNNLGLVLLQQSDFRGASDAFRRALDLKPGFAPALQNLELTKPCEASPPPAVTIPHLRGAPGLSADPKSEIWKSGGSASIVKDCSHRLDYPELSSEVRAFWTDTDLYLLFVCPYKILNVFLPAQNDGPRNKLWDRDVVEVFLGADWKNIRRYREFEIAPTGDWIDLAIDLDRSSYDKTWRSGWETTARIDERRHIWYAAARIPLKAVSEEPVQAGARWRINLYRIEGQGPDATRHFLCWQPTCVVNRDPNHVPEHFGTLIFGE
jgi:tetratricopeptide (TPR) repeat protein